MRANKIYIVVFLCLSVFKVFSQEKIKLKEIDKMAIDNSEEIYYNFDSIVSKSKLYESYLFKIDGNYIKGEESEPFEGKGSFTIKENKSKIIYGDIDFQKNPFNEKKQAISFTNETIANAILFFRYIKEKGQYRWMYNDDKGLWKMRVTKQVKEKFNLPAESDVVISIKLENGFIKEAFLDVTPSGKVNKVSIHSIYLEKNNVGYLSHVEYYAKSNQTGNVIKFNLHFIPK